MEIIKDIKGTRLYSTTEIVDEINKDILDKDFINYYISMPESFQKQVDIRIAENKKQEFYDIVQKISDQQSCSVSDGKEVPFEEHSLYPNIYYNLSKKKELQIKELFVFEKKDTFCPFDCNSINTTRVSLNNKENRKLKMTINACYKCKRLFMTEREYSEVKQTLLDGDYNYKWFYAGGNDEEE